MADLSAAIMVFGQTLAGTEIHFLHSRADVGKKPYIGLYQADTSSYIFNVKSSIS
jgi:hypothetical protein